MNIILMVMSICCFSMGMFFSVVKVNGGIFSKFLLKLVGFVSVFCCLIYWCKLLNIL